MLALSDGRRGIVTPELQVEDVRFVAALEIPSVPHAHAGRMIETGLLLRQNSWYRNPAENRITPLPVQKKLAVLGVCIPSPFNDRKRFRKVFRQAILERPPRPRLRVGGLVGLERRKLFGT